MDLIPHIFHEKQEGQLCAQHAINNLLQGSYFTAVDLSDIARQLDQDELNEGENSISQQESIANFNKDGSNNYDDSGFFSIQVVEKALQIWGLDLIPIRSTNPLAVKAKSNPETMNAFICNLDQHWFSLRRFGESEFRWYNLNSVYNEPRHVTNTYLGMLLQQLETEGYSIYVVDGVIPNTIADQEATINPIPIITSQPSVTKQPIPYDDDDDLEKALAMSLGQSVPAKSDDDLQAALKASMMDYGNDGESMALAISASLSDYESSSTHIQQPVVVQPTENTTQVGNTQSVLGNGQGQDTPSLEELRRKRLERFGG
ncbi:Josephin-domain-containing protein [Globomyces pollinis-pini]|nr:Josephin-domain-containing protein [Globomyces pollinis-pini]